MFDCKRIHSGELVDNDALATFNAERARGIQHSRSYADKMQREQEFFNEIQIRAARALRSRGGF